MSTRSSLAYASHKYPCIDGLDRETKLHVYRETTDGSIHLELDDTGNVFNVMIAKELWDAFVESTIKHGGLRSIGPDINEHERAILLRRMAMLASDKLSR